jgi:hypothetical protein
MKSGISAAIAAVIAVEVEPSKNAVAFMKTRIPARALALTLLVIGMNASHSVADQVSTTFTGRLTNTTSTDA